MSIKNNVDVQPGAGVPAIFHCSQGDKGTRIILGLLNNNDSYTIPEGTTAIIRGSRADGTLFTEITADIDTTTEIKFNLTEDMTSVAGPVECEAVMTSGTANVIGTANFIIDVERSPASIGSVIPGTDAAETWLIDKLENEPLNSLNGESVVDAINDSSGSGLTEDVKVALLACFEKVAWIDEDGQDYYDALYDALYPPSDLVSISAVYTQSGTVYDDFTLNDLKSDLVVTAQYSNTPSETIPSNLYSLSGTLAVGTSTITVSYGGKTTTFDVVVSAPLYPFTTGSHTFTSPAGTIEVYNGNSARVICSTANANDIHANLSTLSSNTAACNSTNNYVVNTPIFTIPAGSVVRTKLIVNEYQSVSTTTYGSSSMRKPSSGTTAAVLVFADTYELKYGISDGTVFEKEETFSEATDISCIGVYFGHRSNSKTNASVDLSFIIYVDGVRYV